LATTPSLVSQEFATWAEWTTSHGQFVRPL